MGITTLYRSLITLALLVASLCSNSQTPNYQLPYYVRANWFSIRWTVPVTSYDSVYVKGINGWMATAPRTTWDNLPLKPTTFTPSAHTHTEYLTSFTETDPTVSSTVKGITAAQVGNWNTAYLWGNHSGLYSLLGHTHTPSQVGLGNVNNTSDIDKPISAATQLALDAIPAYARSLTGFNVIKSSTDLIYKGIGYTPTSTEIIASIGYTPYNGATNPNGYIAQSGARTAISLTTTGTGAATYNNSTGVLNIPTYSAPVSTVFGRSGAVLASSGDYNTSQVTESGNLYFTNPRVLATALTGLSVTDATAVLSTDNVLSAVGKLQAQSTARTPAISSATVGLTRAQLNTAYPNTPVGYMVLAPSITLGGAIYVRATTGSSGTWQIISAPPVL